MLSFQSKIAAIRAKQTQKCILSEEDSIDLGVAIHNYDKQICPGSRFEK